MTEKSVEHVYLLEKSRGKDGSIFVGIFEPAFLFIIIGCRRFCWTPLCLKT